jgi:hypothetical protein
MKKLKILLTGVFIGLLLGLWFGINFGREKPIYSNPFADEVIKQKAKETTSEAIEDTKRALRKSLDD